MVTGEFGVACPDKSEHPSRPRRALSSGAPLTSWSWGGRSLQANEASTREKCESAARESAQNAAGTGFGHRCWFNEDQPCEASENVRDAKKGSAGPNGRSIAAPPPLRLGAKTCRGPFPAATRNWRRMKHVLRPVFLCQTGDGMAVNPSRTRRTRRAGRPLSGETGPRRASTDSERNDWEPQISMRARRTSLRPEGSSSSMREGGGGRDRCRDATSDDPLLGARSPHVDGACPGCGRERRWVPLPAASRTLQHRPHRTGPRCMFTTLALRGRPMGKRLPAGIVTMAGPRFELGTPRFSVVCSTN